MQGAQLTCLDLDVHLFCSIVWQAYQQVFRGNRKILTEDPVSSRAIS